MVFNSLFFFLTLLPLLAVYFSFRDSRSRRAKLLLLVYSYVFYGMWNPAFLSLLIGSSVLDYWVARGLDAWPSRKRLLLVTSLVIEFGLLGFFKYYNFFVGATASVFHLAGFAWDPPLLKILLPIGISFYTFHCVSYTVDVYRGRIRAERSFLDVALFVAFFPQLVAGPILRAGHFLPQLHERPAIRWSDIGDGLMLVLFGLFLKVVVADNIAERVNDLFAHWRTIGVAATWSAAMLFGVQIYMDFNGYSLIAIGLGQILGYHIPINFDAPYGAAGFSDFWRRWHISLSTWLRDYLYIPLGGNRRGDGRTYLNLIITMLLGGLWHGASVMFVIWGAMHGAYLCAERFVRERLRLGASLPQPIASAALIAFTYLTVSVTWIPFRAANTEQGLAMMKRMFVGGGTLDARLADYAIALAVFACHCFSRRYDFIAHAQRSAAVRVASVTVILLLLYFYAGERAEFIYFQF
ncbi:MAG TPA: MBOAT family O-acyltransferase [Vicinamibacterales bacterium]|nr:MBOAT family O-acyltransferase [Vicinamibacterales bacterium]